MMVRASVHRNVGLYNQRQYRNTSDLEMWLRIARRYPIAILESHLMKYRHFHGSSAQRYHRLRTEPENFFNILDEYLAAGDRALATPQSLVNYEAHRLQDRLMNAISCYIKGQMSEGQRAMRDVQLSSILRATQVQKWRLLVLAIGMWLLLRMPRVETIANLMHERWHIKRRPQRTSSHTLGN